MAGGTGKGRGSPSSGVPRGWLVMKLSVVQTLESGFVVLPL